VLSNCLNPACRVPFSHALGGRVISVDHLLAPLDATIYESQTEQYWLCGRCSQSVKIVIENGQVKAAELDLERSSLAG